MKNLFINFAKYDRNWIVDWRKDELHDENLKTDEIFDVDEIDEEINPNKVYVFKNCKLLKNIDKKKINNDVETTCSIFHQHNIPIMIKYNKNNHK